MLQAFLSHYPGVVTDATALKQALASVLANCQAEHPELGDHSVAFGKTLALRVSADCWGGLLAGWRFAPVPGLALRDLSQEL